MNLLPAFLTTGRPSCTPADADLLWSTNPADEEQAKALCETCPLRKPCAAYALHENEQWGTWGGLTAQDRLRIRRGDGWWIDMEGRIREPCGSEAAKRAHHKHGEACDTCTAGHEQRLEERRRAILAVEHALPDGGSVKGYDTHRRLGEAACGRCKAARARACAAKPGRRSAGRTGLSAPEPMALAS